MKTFIYGCIFAVVFITLLAVQPVVATTNLTGEFANLPCAPVSGNGNLTISGGKTNLNLTVGTSTNRGGSISSLRINGTETVNTDDLGREIQYAIFVGPNGWVNSPTEGGSDKGQYKEYPNGYPSKVIEGCSNGNILYTKSQMAYWVPDKSMPNRSPLSPYILTKKVQIGYNGIPNLIRSVARIHNVSADSWYVDENAAYTVPFDKVSLFDVKTKTMRLLSKSEYGTNYNGSTMFPYWFASHGTSLISLSDGQYTITPYLVDPAGDWSYLYGWAGDPKTNYTYTNSTHNIRNLNYPQKDTDYYFENFILVSPNTTAESEIGNLVTRIPRSDIGPYGLFESADCSNLIGWAGDKDQPDNPIDVQFYYSDVGDINHQQFLGKTSTNIVRDAAVCYGLGTNTSPCVHGFNFNTPDFIKDGKPHTIYAYGIDFPTGEKYDLEQNRRDITCLNAPPTLSSPIGAATSTSPQFVWYVVPRATRYWMTVAQADNTYLLNQEITPNCNTTTCWITPQLTLSPGKSYYFKVTAGITTGWGPASTANTFTVSSVGSSISSTSSLKPGDINGDGIVDIFDYNLLVTNFGKTGTVGFIPADINKDGKVDVTDYNLLVQSIKNTN